MSLKQQFIYLPAFLLLGCAQTPGPDAPRAYQTPLPEISLKGTSDAVAVVKDASGRLRFSDTAVTPTVTAPADRPAVAPSQPSALVALSPSTQQARPAAAADQTEALMKSFKAWIAAWEQQDFTAYIDHYSESFRHPRFKDKAQWAAFRKPRIARPKSIQIGVSNLKISMTAAGTATVSYQQAYRSDIFQDNVIKSVVFQLEDQTWRIIEER